MSLTKYNVTPLVSTRSGLQVPEIANGGAESGYRSKHRRAEPVSWCIAELLRLLVQREEHAEERRRREEERRRVEEDERRRAEDDRRQREDERRRIDVAERERMEAVFAKEGSKGAYWKTYWRLKHQVSNERRPRS